MTRFLCCDLKPPTSTCSLDAVLARILQFNEDFKGVEVYPWAQASKCRRRGDTLPKTYVIIQMFTPTGATTVGESFYEHDVQCFIRVYGEDPGLTTRLSKLAQKLIIDHGYIEFCDGYACLERKTLGQTTDDGDCQFVCQRQHAFVVLQLVAD